MSKILLIIPYKFYPPTNGGRLRCFYIFQQLSLSNDIYLLTTQNESEFTTNHLTTLPNNVKFFSLNKVKKYKSGLNYLLPQKYADALNTRILRKSLKVKANDYFLRAYPILKKINKNENIDLVLYENLESLFFFKSFIKIKNKKILHVLDVHNIDSELWMMHFKTTQNKVYKAYAKQALYVEQNLYKSVNAFFCCSESDNQKLTLLNNHKISGIVIPNGVDCSLKLFDNNLEKSKLNNILFCGSLDYQPNIDGLLWFYKEIFPLVRIDKPELRLTVIGKGANLSDYQTLINDTKVNFIGEVDSVEDYYYNASIAIVPLKQGSGTRLKILEAMSYGIPVVSTSKGAEGIDYASGKDILIAEKPIDFASKISELVNCNTLYNSIRFNAYSLVKNKYDWVKIGVKIRDSVKILINEKDR
jgi:glycosyltransferase involved in cell wall biosynthesis